MTTTHTIDVEAERVLFEAEMRRQYGADRRFLRHTDGLYASMAWRDTFDGWLAAKRSMSAPASPVDDRNAASPAAPAGQHELPRTVLLEHEIGGIMGNWNRTSNSRYELCRAVEAAVIARFRAEGGETKQLFEKLEDLAPAGQHDAAGGGWMPIETAPQDGTYMLLSNGATVSQGWWVHEEPYIREQRDADGRYIDQDESDGFDGWIDCEGGMLPEPTHWMPLPPPPAAQSSIAGSAAGGITNNESSTETP